MTVPRLCSKTACGRPAVATLTYNYADSQVVLGPLATFAEPHSYDMCADHARRLTAPRGWDVVRLVDDFVDPDPAPDELVAIADAIRNARLPEPARPQQPEPSVQQQERRTVVAAPRPETHSSARPDPRQATRPGVDEVSAVEVGRRGHLRVLRDGLDGDGPAPR